jgi:hypothetical protein
VVTVSDPSDVAWSQLDAADKHVACGRASIAELTRTVIVERLSTTETVSAA